MYNNYVSYTNDAPPPCLGQAGPKRRGQGAGPLYSMKRERKRGGGGWVGGGGGEGERGRGRQTDRETGDGVGGWGERESAAYMPERLIDGYRVWEGDR
jgi:hypothetical protein